MPWMTQYRSTVLFQFLILPDTMTTIYALFDVVVLVKLVMKEYKVKITTEGQIIGCRGMRP